MTKSIKNSVPTPGTFSKSDLFFGKDFPIQYFTEGRGAHVKAQNGKWLLDWISGLGATILGHGNVGFEQHVNMWLRRGIGFSMPHQLEYEVAEQLNNLLRNQVPGWQDKDIKTRWVLSGSDACNAAIRLARAITGRKTVLSYGYHGWADTFIGATPPAHGITEQAVETFDIGNYLFFQNYESPDRVAAVIFEVGPQPISTAWFDFIRDWCTKHGALLIVDEVVTGLRYARGGACELFNIKPDLICMGKALGNGLPIAALVGPDEYLQWFDPSRRSHNDPVFVSSTNVGSVPGLAAANWLLNYVRDGKYLKHIWTIGEMLRNDLVGEGINVIGNAPRSVIIWPSDGYKAFFINGMYEHGILVNRPNFAHMSHKIEHVDMTVEAAKEVHAQWHMLNEQERATWEAQAPLVMFRNR